MTIKRYLEHQELYGGLLPTANDTDGGGLYDGPDVSADYALDGKPHHR